MLPLRMDGLREHKPSKTAVHARVNTGHTGAARARQTNVLLGRSQRHGRPCVQNPSAAVRFRQLPAQHVHAASV